MSLRSDRSGARMDTTTSPMTIGSLCSGISGLDMGVTAATGARTAWFCEREPAPRQVLARHYADVPNHGDVTTVDWASVEPVDIITAGWPCQPFSHAGNRKGANDERHLWPHVADCIRRVGPRYVFLENVRGHLTLGFDRVLGGLADQGFDAEWGVFRASHVGSPHKRERLFVAARHPDRIGGNGGAGEHGAHRGQVTTRATGEPCRHCNGTGVDWRTEYDRQPFFDRCRYCTPPADAHGQGLEGAQPTAGHLMPAGRATADPHVAALGQEPQRIGRGRGAVVAGLDAPPAADADGRGCRIDEGKHGDAPHATESHNDDRHELARRGDDRCRPHMGRYEAAVGRWEAIHGPAPHPLADGRLNPSFVEWMMGYPAGWVDGLTRAEALKALGNAVVPQVAELAWRELAA